MSVSRPERAPSRRGGKVTELRPPRPPRTPREKAAPLGSPDYGYMFALVALVSTGLIMVYSATAVYWGSEDLVKMGVWMLLGIPAVVIAARIPFTFWRRVTPLLMAGCGILLGSLLLPESLNPFALNVNGATRWLQFPGFVVQPSEPAKLAFVLFAARFLEKRGERMTGNHWMAFLMVLGGLFVLIYLEPDLGTGLVLIGTAFCMLIAAGVRVRDLILLALAGILALGVLAWNKEHQRERLLAWWNPWEEQYVLGDGYQVTQSWMAMARGGLSGVGLGQSTQKLENRLPESETDFIFAIVAEELGLIRAVGVLLLFGLLAWRGYSIAARAPDRYSSLIASGITSWIAVQSCLNVAVATGTVPNTGVPLPFISSGGSSLVTLLFATGIVIGISQRTRSRKEAALGA